MANTNLLAGWVGMLAGVISGALIGLFFHDEKFMGGYASYRRRLVRLGHISFFGLGFVNILFALSVAPLGIVDPWLKPASIAFLVGAASMPVCCFLSAWRKPLRHLFPIPVVSTVAGVLSLLFGYTAK